MEREPSPEVLRRALEVTRGVEVDNNMLGALGLYSVNLANEIETPEHPEDCKWAIDDDSINIIRSNN